MSPGPDEPDLVEAAAALDGTLRRLREVVERALHGSLTTRKQRWFRSRRRSAFMPVR
jgi:hypothetical protein